MRTKANKNYLKEIVISIILVTQNHEGIISDVIKQINKILNKKYPNYEIIIIDNDSKDKTIEIVKNLYKQVPHIRIIRLSKSYDIDIAYTAGLENCIGDYAVLIDINFDLIETIPLALSKSIEGYDFVSAQPKVKDINKWSISNIFLSALTWLSNQKFNYQPIYLLALNRKVISTLTRIRRKSRNFIYLNNPLGFSKTILYFQIKKVGKIKKMSASFIELLLITIDIIISNSFKPMRVVAALGMLVSLLFIFYSVAALILATFFNTYLISEGLIAISIMIGIMFFTILSFLTLISEYLIRILDESRNEPLYYIYEEIDESSVITSNRNKLNIV